MSQLKKSNFSVTCNLLSQYLKEKRIIFPQEPIKELGLFQHPTTLNLFPGGDLPKENVSVSDQNVTEERHPERNGQLTIFYGGKVIVFDDFSAEKAEDLMMLASKGSSSSYSLSRVNLEKFNTPDMPMPIARRASLHRFLEKRKDRVNSKAPYQMNASSKIGSSPIKPQEERTWLGLGLEASN